MPDPVFLAYGFYKVDSLVDLDGILNQVLAGQIEGARFAASITGEYDAMVAFSFDSLPDLEQAVFTLRSESSVAIGPFAPMAPKMWFTSPCFAFIRVWATPGTVLNQAYVAQLLAHFTDPDKRGIIVAGDFNVLLEVGNAAPVQLATQVASLISVAGVQEARASFVSRWVKAADPNFPDIVLACQGGA